MRWCAKCGQEFDPYTKKGGVCEFCIKKGKIVGMVKSRRTFKLKRLFENLPTGIHKNI